MAAGLICVSGQARSPVYSRTETNAASGARVSEESKRRRFAIRRRPRWLALGLAAGLSLATTACTKESRTLGPEQPQTPPNGPADPRASYFENNDYQVSQGGRYFTWYGCGGCHGDNAAGALDLAGDQHRHPARFDQLYAAIADGHTRFGTDYGAKIPTEQLWQITAYVHELASLKPERRRRQDLDEAGEPQGNSWSGPVR